MLSVWVRLQLSLTALAYPHVVPLAEFRSTLTDLTGLDVLGSGFQRALGLLLLVDQVNFVVVGQHLLFELDQLLPMVAKKHLSDLRQSELRKGVFVEQRRIG